MRMEERGGGMRMVERGGGMRMVERLSPFTEVPCSEAPPTHNELDGQSVPPGGVVVGEYVCRNLGHVTLVMSVQHRHSLVISTWTAPRERDQYHYSNHGCHDNHHSNSLPWKTSSTR